MPSLLRRAAAALAVTALAASVAACSNDPVADQYLEGDNKGYIAGDGRVVEIAPEDRGDPVSWEGVTEYDEELSSDDLAGQVTVVNFWFAACGPCIVEAPLLEEVWQEFEDDGVQFVGVNTSDQAHAARSFAADHEITYPSIIDVHTGSVKLAFAAHGPLSATPVTLVLDAEGRVAARVVGQLQSASILRTLVSDTLGETA